MRQRTVMVMASMDKSMDRATDKVSKAPTFKRRKGVAAKTGRAIQTKYGGKTSSNDVEKLSSSVSEISAKHNEIEEDEDTGVSLALTKRKELDKLRKNRYHGLSIGSSQPKEPREEKPKPDHGHREYRSIQFQRAAESSTEQPQSIQSTKEGVPEKPKSSIDGLLREIQVSQAEPTHKKPKSKPKTLQRLQRQRLDQESDLDKKVDALFKESSTTSAYLAPSFSNPEPRELTTFEKHAKEEQVRRMHAGIELAMRTGVKRGSANARRAAQAKRGAKK